MAQIIILILGSFLIFILSTLSGGGASLLLMPIIAFTIGVKSVAPIMTLGIAVSSSSRVYLFFKDIDWNLFKWLFPSTIIGSILGANAFASFSSDFLQLIIGLFLVSTVFQLFMKPKPDKKSWLKAWHFVPIGFLISFLSGLIGGVGPLMNAAYLKYGMTKEALIGTRSANAVILHITKIASYAYFGYVNGEVLKYGLILGGSAIVGNIVGKRILTLISQKLFRIIVIISMIVSGIMMLYKHKDYISELIQGL